MAATKIVFLVLPHMHLLDLAGPDQVFLEAMDMGADIKVEYCSLEKSNATSSQFPVGNLRHFSKVVVKKGDYLFIAGAQMSYLTSAAFTKQKEVMAWVRNLHMQGVNICSVCTAAFFVAQTGLLNGKKCTTHWQLTTQLQQRYPSVKVIENILFVEDDHIYSSAGVTAGIDMALHIVSRLTDEHLSFKVARELVVYARRGGAEAQDSVFTRYRNHLHSGIHAAQDYVQAHIHKKLVLSDLAETCFMSPRNFTRVFKKETGITVNNYITEVRRQVLYKLKQDPGTTVKQMTRLCGLQSERQVIRILNTLRTTS